MRYKQNGSIQVVFVGLLMMLIIGALTYVLLNNLAPKSNTTPGKNTAPQNTPIDNKTYAEFKDWKVRFPSNTSYNLKRNSATGNETAYFISIPELAKTCVTPDTPWLGIIRRYENPHEKITLGPRSGQTPNQLFGKTGITIDGKLFVFNTTTKFCTRNTLDPEVERAASKLKTEIQRLESY